MIEYNRDMINRQNKSSFIQWIFIEYLKHNSAYLDASDRAVNTTFKAHPMGLQSGSIVIFDKFICSLMSGRHGTTEKN